MITEAIVLGDADRPAEVGGGLAGSSVANQGPSPLRDVLRAAARIERERRLPRLRRAAGPVADSPFPGVLAKPGDMGRLPEQQVVERRRVRHESITGRSVIVRAPDDVPQIGRGTIAGGSFAAVPFLGDGDWHGELRDWRKELTRSCDTAKL